MSSTGCVCFGDVLLINERSLKGEEQKIKRGEKVIAGQCYKKWLVVVLIRDRHHDRHDSNHVIGSNHHHVGNSEIYYHGCSRNDVFAHFDYDDNVEHQAARPNP